MILHSVLISYNRLELTKRALQSYLDTCTLPYTLDVVDNGSGEETVEWLDANRGDTYNLVLLHENKYPGYACNVGFSMAPEKATHLHRMDNDFIFIRGWCWHVQERFRRRPQLGQLGLRTNAEELHVASNVGGNMMLRRQLWDAGLRYDETPWPLYPPGWTEDSFLSPEVRKMGWEWDRVSRPCIVPISHEDPDDPYYKATWNDRGIHPSQQ
jgi:glycosyltransferase involved in cell wall biosynthesis